MGSVKATCHPLIGSSISKVLFFNLNFLNLAPLWTGPSTINKCASLLYFNHGMSREMLSKFSFTYSCDHTSKLALLLNLA